MHTKNDEFAAVTVPCGLTKAAFNFANFSIGDTLIPLSFSITLDVFGTKQNKKLLIILKL